MKYPNQISSSKKDSIKLAEYYKNIIQANDRYSLEIKLRIRRKLMAASSFQNTKSSAGGFAYISTTTNSNYTEKIMQKYSSQYLIIVGTPPLLRPIRWATREDFNSIKCRSQTNLKMMMMMLRNILWTNITVKRLSSTPDAM